MDKRFIEESFPVKEISKESAHEKYINKGHISTMHIWWARRPLASSRASNYAALIPKIDDIEDWNNKKNFIIDLCKWNNSLNQNILKAAKGDINEYYGDQKPKILDPFSGGGAIPLEALRIGCETYASDYNPVAVLIEKCTLEYPQIFGNKLKNEVKKWSDWIFEEVKNEINKFFPKYTENMQDLFGETKKNYTPLFYLWSRTLKCQNPSCEIEIPLLKSKWLVKKKNKRIFINFYFSDGKLKFKIENVPTSHKCKRQNCDCNYCKGTISGAMVECPLCKTIIEASDVRKIFKNGKTKQRIMAVVYKDTLKKEKKYILATQSDEDIYEKSNEYLTEKNNKLKLKWALEPVPDEGLVKTGGNQMAVLHYGLNTFGDLFNSRQLLLQITYIEKIREVYDILKKKKYDSEFTTAIISYLGLIIGRMQNWNSVLCRWRSDQERNESVFARQALPMIWDYAEKNPFIGATMTSKTINSVIDHCSKVSSIPGKVIQASAIKLPWDDCYFDAVFTDPPYYDNIFYSNLSDFFYVWLKRSVGYLYPELFSTHLTPKTNEIVADKIRHNSKDEAREFFEINLKKAFKEIHRVLKPNGISIIVYAHKTTEGWETVINALLESGLSVTASWPISTEMKGRLLSKDSATLASSIYIISRKIEKQEIGLYNEIKQKMKTNISQKLERLWKEGLSGVDFFIAAIGAGIEVFGIFEKIIDFEGKVIKADKLLGEIRNIVIDFVLKQILSNGFSTELSALTRFYILWRWQFQEGKVIFDEAKKLAQSVGINLDKVWNKGFIRKGQKFISVLGPKNRKIREIGESTELIDILHYILLLWEKGEKEKILEKLAATYGENEIFYKTALAISQFLPNESKEKKLIDGFLSGKERIKESIKESKTQDSLERFLK